MIKMAINMLWIDRKKALNLMLSIIATFLVCMIFIQFFTNPYLTEITAISHNVVFGDTYTLSEDIVNFSDNFAVLLLSLVLLIICTFLISYSCYYHCLKSSREIGILKLSGYNTFQIVCYKMIQITVIIILAAIFSLLLSLLVIPLVLKLINIFTGYDIPLLSFFFRSYLLFSIVVIFIFILVVSLEVRYAFSSSISHLLVGHNINSYKEDNRALKIPDVVYMIAYIVGLFTMYLEKNLNVGFAIAASIGAIGAYGMFYYWIPHTIIEMLDDLDLSGEKYVVLGDVAMFMQQSKTLIFLIMLSVILFPIFILVTKDRTYIQVALHIGFILTNILLSTSLINRFLIDNHEKAEHYLNLSKIGLTDKEVINISQQQGQIFYLVFWLMTIIYILFIIFAFYLRGIFDTALICIVPLEFIIPYSLSQIAVYIYKGRKT